jgi:phage-related protein
MSWRERASGAGGRRVAWAAAVAAAAVLLTGGAVVLAGTAATMDAAPAAASDTLPAVHAATVGPAILAGVDRPGGFLYGTDSSQITISGSAPYREPVIRGEYGGYIGMAGNWARWAGCGNKVVVYSGTNSAQADKDYTAYHIGIGTGVYWFMAGPGVDPHYNGTTSEAYSWGEKQAASAIADAAELHVTYPVLFMDIEIPGDASSYTPAYDNGWNTVYTSACSGVAKAYYIASTVDRADVNGFAAYLTGHSSYKAGVYSAPSIWTEIFGTGSSASIPNTYEWTYQPFTSSLSRRPDGWCLSGTATCASFFGGQTSGSKYALMWQWSGGGGSYNGYGDFDQIDVNRTP